MSDTTAVKPAHEAMTAFEVLDGELHVGGMPLRRLAQRVGRTPFYAYERTALERRVAQLRAALPSTVQLHYAMKANPMPAVVAFVGRLVDGVDVASAGELKVALDAGARPRDISFAGPGKRVEELRQAVAAGVLLNVESFAEIDALARIQDELGLLARVAVRVNPDFELKGSGMKMGGGPKPFGIDAQQVPRALTAIATHGLAFEGFHLYAGSQNLRADAIVQAQLGSYELALRLAGLAPSPVKVLNLGGGFGIPYFPGERQLALGPVGEGLHSLAQRAAREMPGAQLVVELGRYLVGEAGIYVARIVDRKESSGHEFWVTDGGLHHHLAASGNFGQVVRKNYPVAVGHRVGAPGGAAVSVVGPLCTPLDLLADRMNLPPAEVGDLVVVFQSGAYGASASPRDFLGHPSCVEVLV
jgi:diaminopimelate decarboxylase